MKRILNRSLLRRALSILLGLSASGGVLSPRSDMRGHWTGRKPGYTGWRGREFATVFYGIDQARRAGLEKTSVLNCLPWTELVRLFKR
jgi:hypothetical protein